MALAATGEILASRDTVDSVPPGVTPSTPRTGTLMGLSEPLEPSPSGGGYAGACAFTGAEMYRTGGIDRRGAGPIA